MKKYHLLFGALIIPLLMMSSCQKVSNPANSQASTEVSTSKSWQDQLTEMMPYLGHRNWIVIADMAYPLQSGSGITTLYADEPYLDVLEKVKGMIDKAPHVFAHIYRDKELSFISEKDMPGVDSLRAGMDRICGNEASSVVHEDLIARLDAAGRLYSVVIIKTPLTMAYTTTFFELDCAYWNGDQQKKLDEAMGRK